MLQKYLKYQNTSRLFGLLTTKTFCRIEKYFFNRPILKYLKLGFMHCILSIDKHPMDFMKILFKQLFNTLVFFSNINVESKRFELNNFFCEKTTIYGDLEIT